MTSAEKFICRVYNVADAESCNEARATLFYRCRSPRETLPPTSDEVRLHIRRVHIQAMIWKQARLTTPTLQLPETMGWLRLKDKIVPKLMSLAPVPDTCDEMVNCDCESRKKIRGNLCRLPSAVNVKLQLSNERNCRLQLFFLASKTMSISSFTLKDDAYFLSVAHVPCVM